MIISLFCFDKHANILYKQKARGKNKEPLTRIKKRQKFHFQIIINLPEASKSGCNSGSILIDIPNENAL